jgi:UDP-N-acetylglucosamine--N-acetylmuramyl-(pentapeptide) pyrophosphoryl-undecaprenol N-acetylglucosamine transferase
LIWQTGKLYHEQALEAISAHAGGHICVKDFIYEMDLAYAAADIIVSRAGAMSISELSLVGKPAILIPLPSAAEDHQTKNAQALVDKNAGILIPDANCKAALSKTVFELLSDDVRQQELGSNIRTMAMPDADIRIAEIALGLISNTRTS